MKRSPSPRRSNIDGGGEGPSFEGKTIFLSSKEKEKKKKISFSSKEEDNEDDHGQSGGDGGGGGPCSRRGLGVLCLAGQHVVESHPCAPGQAGI